MTRKDTPTASSAPPRESDPRPDDAGAAASSYRLPLLWPVVMAASASDMTAAFFKQMANNWAAPTPREPPREPGWSTQNAIACELPSMRLRDFSRGAAGQPALICAPFALHGATVADLAPGHSVVEALRRSGVARLFVTDWRTATRSMRYFSIDSYLADLNVAVDDIGAPVDLIGLCQGGWMALVYAARFPHKVRRLVMVGAPVDVRAAESGLSRTAARTPLPIFESLVRAGEGLLLGTHVLELWAPRLIASEAGRVLQETPAEGDARLAELRERFDAWYEWTVDLPGVYYLEVVQRLFKENQIAQGRFVALGQTIDLSALCAPLYLLAGRDDELVHPAQLFAAADLVCAPKSCIETAVAPCSHLSLFLGARTLAQEWPQIGQWLTRALPAA